MRLTAIITIFTALMALPALSTADETSDEPKVITSFTGRVIKVEGTIEKPRVLFIVPKAKLWKPLPDKTDFTEKLLKPPYPEALVASPEETE